MTHRPPLTDREIADSLGGDRDVAPDLVDSISRYARSTPQRSGGVLAWLWARPVFAGGRTMAVALLILALLLALGIGSLVGSPPTRLTGIPPTPSPSPSAPAPSGPVLPAGWSHVADVPREAADGVNSELDGLLVLTNAERGELAFLDPAAGDGGPPMRVDLGGTGRGLPMARSADGWWIAIGSTRELVRFDPVTRTVVQRVLIGVEGYNVAVDGAIVYVADFEAGRVVRVDTSTDGVTASIELPSAAGIAVLADGRVLVASRPGTLRELDPVTLETIEEIAIQGDVVTLMPDGDRVIITRNNADRLSTIDPYDIAAGEELIETRISAFIVTPDVAWGIDWATSDVLRIDRATLAVVERIPALSAGQDGIALAAGDLWIEGTSDAGPVVHRLRPPALAAP
jgi:hypothetical protein